MVSCDLLEDVTIHILSFLPVKSLMRFKCVCKSWCALIESSTFIAQHLNHYTFNNNNGNGALLVKYRIRKDIYSFSLLSEETFEVSANLPNLYFPEDQDIELEMLACCNGIICLHEIRSGYLVLYNPATIELKDLPESCIPLPPGTKFSGGHDVGFGFDVKTNDYKVVRVGHRRYENDNQWANNQVEVYSLSTDSWRLIDAIMPTSIIRRYREGIYLNGIYFWWTIDRDDGFLITFDMSDEVFQSIPLPDVIFDSDYEDHYQHFEVLNESIALILFQYEGFEGMEQFFEIWVLNGYGVKESWIKLYKFGPIFGPWYPLRFWKNSELFLFMESEEKEQLALYDPVTQEFKNVQVDGDCTRFGLLVYKESLVSIKGGNGPTKVRTG